MRLNEIKLWKFNILDLTILFVIMILVLVFVSTNSKATSSGDTTSVSTNSKANFEYTIEVKGVVETSSLMLKSGDKLYDKVTGTEIGTIKKVEANRAKGYFNKLNGEIVLRDVPTRIDLLITVEASGSIKNGEYLANDLIRILVGGSKQFKTKYIMFIGNVVDLKNK